MTRKLILSIALFLTMAAYAMEAPKTAAYVVISDRTGNVDTVRVGSSASTSYEAPLQVSFHAGITDVEPGQEVFCEWRVVRKFDDEGTPREEEYLVRREPDHDYEFQDDGTFTVSFAYSYTDGSGSAVPGDEQPPLSFSIDVSDLYVPNAFSPNGDGKNDVFKVRVKSIVSFHMVIFNRWGKIVASGDQNSLEYEAGDDNNGYYICWDGTSGGDVVPDGTYFINIEAEGAGGRHYTRKSDINILTGLGLDDK